VKYYSALILVSFGFIGDFILDKLHISKPSFQIAGGILLLITAITMVIAKQSGLSSPTQDKEREAEYRMTSVFFL